MLLKIYRQRRRILTGTLAAVLMLVLGVESRLPSFFDGPALVWGGTLLIMAGVFALAITVLTLTLPRLRHIVEVGAFAGLIDVSARRFLPELFADLDSFVTGDLFIVVVFLAAMLFFYGELADAVSTEFSYRGQARLRTASDARTISTTVEELGWSDQVELTPLSQNETHVTLTDTRHRLRLREAMRSWFDDAAGLRADALRAHLAA